MKTKTLFYGAREFRLTVCKETSPGEKTLGDNPQVVVDYLRKALDSSPFYRPDRENFIAIFLNTRRRIIGFEIVSQGILDTVLVHSREIFRPAIVANAHAVILCHNHPGGDSREPLPNPVRSTQRDGLIPGVCTSISPRGPRDDFTSYQTPIFRVSPSAYPALYTFKTSIILSSFPSIGVLNRY